MLRRPRLAVIWLVLFLGASGIPSVRAQDDPAGLPLVQPSDLTYLGAFRVPPNSDVVGASPGRNGFDYAKTGFAFNPARNSLFLNNHIYDSRTAEIGVPDSIVQSDPLCGYAVAQLLPTSADCTE